MRLAATCPRLFLGVCLAAAAAVGQDEAGWWAYRPLQRPPVPAVANADWVRGPVDAFILHQLEARGLSPSPAADRHTLLRRITYDLTGLPPTNQYAVSVHCAPES